MSINIKIPVHISNLKINFCTVLARTTKFKFKCFISKLENRLKMQLFLSVALIFLVIIDCTKDGADISKVRTCNDKKLIQY